MTSKTLHITNGGALTSYLADLQIEGEILTWHEMLCEGPTIEDIDSNEFIEIRQQFLQEVYEVEIDVIKVKQDVSKLDCIEKFDEITLWFEYDLFCHINLMAVINLLLQKKIHLPMYLVCSGRIPGVKELKGLAELSTGQLFKHYDERITLNDSDLEIAKSVWQLYNGKDHNLLKPYIVQHSSFKYLSNCLKAHLQRFPNVKNGLNELELNILKIINTNEIKSRNHLLGYALNYQGYYGYGDMLFERIINNLGVFFIETEDRLTLNEKGLKAMNFEENFEELINDQMTFGGVKKNEFNFDPELNKLVKARSAWQSKNLNLS